MMNFFWPQYTKIGATPGVRIGRLLHWCGLALGGLCLIGLSSKGDFEGFLIGIAAAFALHMIGRALRYLFAGE